MTRPSRSGGEKGEVVALFLKEAHRRPPAPVSEALALLDRGLAGNLHSADAPGGDRQVLLADVDDLSSLDLKPGALREQITVRMPELMGLASGERLEVGEAVLEITEACEPCTHIGRLLGRPDRESFRLALIGHRGMLARVVGVRGRGRIAVGDPVRVTQGASS